MKPLRAVCLGGIACILIGGAVATGITHTSASQFQVNPPDWRVDSASVLVNCQEEDGSTPGQEFPCAWTASQRGNGSGRSYVLTVLPTAQEIAGEARHYSDLREVVSAYAGGASPAAQLDTFSSHLRDDIRTGAVAAAVAGETSRQRACAEELGLASSVILHKIAAASPPKDLRRMWESVEASWACYQAP